MSQQAEDFKSQASTNLLGSPSNRNNNNNNIYREESNQNHSAIGKKTYLTVVISIGLIIVTALSCVSYSMLSLNQQQNNDDIFESIITYEQLYDIFMIVFVVVVIAVCLIYFGEYLFEDIDKLSHPRIFGENPNNSQDLKIKRTKYGFCTSICGLIWELRFDKTTIAAFLCMIHELFCSILLWSRVARGESTKYIITGFKRFFQAFSTTLPVFALMTYVSAKNVYEEGAGKIEKEVSASIANKSRAMASNQSIFSNDLVKFAICIAIISQFVLFVMFPAFDRESFRDLMIFMYECERTTSCSDNPFFIANELICRLFVGMTLLNTIFLAISIFFNEDPKAFSFGDLYKLINPCLWPLIAILLLTELKVIYTQNQQTQDRFNWVFIVVHIALIALPIPCWLICQFLHIYKEKLKSKIDRHYSFYQVSKSLVIEGIFLSLFNLMAIIFLTAHKFNTSVGRQWAVYVFICYECLIIYHLLLIQRHPRFARKLSAPKYKKAMMLFRIISFINLYDYLYVFVFQASQFLSLVSNNSDDSIANRLAFSFSFAISQFSFWALSEGCNFLIKYSNQIAQLNENESIDAAADSQASHSNIDVYDNNNNNSDHHQSKQNILLYRARNRGKRAKSLDVDTNRSAQLDRDDVSVNISEVATYSDVMHMKTGLVDQDNHDNDK